MEGAPRSRTAAPLEPAADGRSSDHWYNVLGSTSPGADNGETAPGLVHESNGPQACANGDTGNAADLVDAVRQLAEQNARLADRLGALALAQERHEAQGGQLEAKVDRLCGLLAAGQSDEGLPLDDAITRRVTESMKPFFLAIIDLLELSMRRAPAGPNAPSPPRRSSADETVLHQDEPPTGLPEILTKPLEELIDAGPDRARPAVPDDTSRRGPQPTAGTTHAAPQGSRAFSWTPVIPEASKR